MSEGQPRGEYWAQDSISKEDLLNDDEFLRDAALHLSKRTNEYFDPIEEKEELYSAYVEYQRSSVNEVSAFKNYAYTQRESTTDEDKERMGKLQIAWDRLGDADTGAWEYIKDYGEAILTSPSTILGLGAGKLAGIAAGKGVGALAKHAATKGLSRGLQSKVGQIGAASAGTAVFEGGMAGGGDYYQQLSEVEARTQRTEGSTLEEKDEIDMKRLGLTAVGAGVSAGAMSGLFRAKGISSQAKTDKLLKDAEDAATTRRQKANAKADEVAKENKELYDEVVNSADVIKEAEVARTGKPRVRKGALEPERVARGEELGRDILDEATDVDITARVATKEQDASEFVEGSGVTRKISDDTITRELTDDFSIDIKLDTIKRISAFAVKLASDRLAATGAKSLNVGGKADLRITDILANELDELAGTTKVVDGKTVTKGLDEVDLEVKAMMDEFDLDFSDIASLFAAEFSKAGKTLQIASQNRNSLSKFFIEMRSSVSKQELDGAVDSDIQFFSRVYQELKNLDLFARGLMTAQPATTIRNTVGAGLRVLSYSLTNSVAGIGEIAVGKALGKDELIKAGLLNLESTKNIFKYLGGAGAESKAIRELAKGASEEGRMAFRAMADISSHMPTDKLRKVRKTTQVVDGKTVEVEKVVSATPFTDVLVKGARYLNAFNTASDNLFKTAVHAAELAKQVGGEKKLLNLAREGKFNTIPHEKLKAAADEALFLAYQKGYKKGTLGSGFITTFSTPFTSPFIPFPRFVVNSLEFTYQHAPLIGAIGDDALPGMLGGKVFGKSNRGLSQRLAQQVTGFAMLAGGFQLRAAMGESTLWYEVKNKAGELYDLRALYGPYAIYMLMSDIVYRTTEKAERIASVEGRQDEVSLLDLDFSDRTYWQEALSEISLRDTSREILKATFGTTFKTGVNVALLQKSFEEALEAGEVKSIANISADVLGNWMNRFTVPVGVAKDVLGTFDPAYLKMEDTREINFGAMLWARARRSIPRALRDENGIFAFTEEGAKVSPTRDTTPTRGELPIIKQLTGATPKADRNKLENELVKIYGGEGYMFKLFPKVTANPTLRKQLDAFYGDISASTLTALIESDDYRSLVTDNQRRAAIKKQLDIEFKDVDVVNYLRTWAENNIEDPKKRQELVNDAFKVKYKSTGGKSDKTEARRRYNASVRSSGRDVPLWDDLPYDQRLYLLEIETGKR